MECVVEFWGLDFYCLEERELQRGVCIGLGSENVIFQLNEFEYILQEDDLGFKEEDLVLDYEVGNVFFKFEGIQNWDDLWVQREGLGKFQFWDRGFWFLGELCWGQVSSDWVVVCGECGKSFRQMLDLVKYQWIYIGEKFYKCGVCGKGFGDSFVWIKYQWIYSGEKFYRVWLLVQGFLKIFWFWIFVGECFIICGECGKSFWQSFDLVKYQWIYIGEKFYKCGICGKGFGDSFVCIKYQWIYWGEQFF